MSQSVLRNAFKSTDYANARKVCHGDWRDDRPPHGRTCCESTSECHGKPVRVDTRKR
ncbi:hypothetical protein [Shewanella oncorhynchi]|uniref:hypothetical protein n=1 Tax=Shewanella oncorhynchi TaxID=2726434 RepID=UPI003D7A4F33